jgi:hypothetical protein
MSPATAEAKNSFVLVFFDRVAIFFLLSFRRAFCASSADEMRLA